MCVYVHVCLAFLFSYEVKSGEAQSCMRRGMGEILELEFRDPELGGVALRTRASWKVKEITTTLVRPAGCCTGVTRDSGSIQLAIALGISHLV